MANNKIVQLIIGARDDASKVLDKVKNGIFGFKSAIVGAFAAIGSISFFNEAANAANALQEQLGRLRGVIEATGGSAGVTAEQIDQFARELDEATLGGADRIREAAAQLLTFKTIAEDTFFRTLTVAQDLSDVLRTDITQSTIQLAKALEDPVRGLGALRRVGVSFTEEQQTLIKSLVETNQLLQAQDEILKAVEGQVKGAASAAGAGLAGAQDLVNKRLTDFKEIVGQLALPALTAAFNGVASAVGSITAKLKEAVPALKEFFGIEEEISKLNLEDLAHKQARLTQQIKEGGEQYERAKRALQALARAGGESGAQAEQYRSTLNRLELELQDYQRELDITNARLFALQNPTKKTAEETANLGDTALETIPKINKLTAVTDEQAKALLKLAEQLKQGILSQSQYDQAVERTLSGYDEEIDRIKRIGDELQQSRREREAATNSAKNFSSATKESAKSQEDFNRQAAHSGGLLGAIYDQINKARTALGEYSQAAVDAFDLRLAQLEYDKRGQLATATRIQSDEQQRLQQQIKATQSAIKENNLAFISLTGSVARFQANVDKAFLETKLAVLEQQEAVQRYANTLNRSLSDGVVSVFELRNATARLTDSLGLLGEEQLRPLNDAIARAKGRMEDLFGIVDDRLKDIQARFDQAFLSAEEQTKKRFDQELQDLQALARQVQESGDRVRLAEIREAIQQLRALRDVQLQEVRQRDRQSRETRTTNTTLNSGSSSGGGVVITINGDVLDEDKLVDKLEPYLERRQFLAR